jgi:PAS domain S-box-containing protein
MSTLEPHQPLRTSLLYAESLEEINDRYEQIFNNSIDVIYLMEVTPDGRFIYRDVNTAYTEVTGIPRESVIGLSVEKIEDEAFRTILIDKFTTALNAGGKTDYIAEYPFPAGIRTFHSTLSPMFDESGRIHRIVGIARDITELKRHEEHLRQSEEAFRTLAENYPDIVVRYDRSCRRIYVNPAYEKIYGIQTKQLLETTPLEYSPLIAPRYFMGELTNAIESATPSDHELAVFRTDGEIGWYMASLIPEFDGKKVIGILCVARDITQSKHYEMALQKSAQMEKTMSRMAANLPGFVYTLHRSPDGRASFPYASSGIYTLFGLLPENVFDDMSILYTLIHPDDLPPIEEAVALSASEMSQCHIIFRTQIAGREERWIEARATPKVEADGGGILWHGVMLDITERIIAESTIEHITKQLKASEFEKYYAYK